MNAAIMAAIAASSAEASGETVVDRLRKQGATNAARAVALDLANDAAKKELDEALGRGVVIKRADGHYYVSERAVADRNEGLGFGVLLALLIVASMLASGIALVMFVLR